MKRSAVWSVAAFAFTFVLGSAVVSAQGTFKIPFKFEAGGKPFPPGEYRVEQKGDGQIALRQESKGGDVPIPFTERLPQPKPPLAEPQLIFDMVGNFEPSYSEYITDYLLAEVWLPGEDGFLVLATKGTHQHQAVKGQMVKK